MKMRRTGEGQEWNKKGNKEKRKDREMRKKRKGQEWEEDKGKEER